jgi:predicted metal-binding protein
MGVFATLPTRKEVKMDGDKKARPQGKADGETLKDDLERYSVLAKELGASDAIIVPANKIVVDERVRLKCTIPRCTRAGETPNCPPYAPDLETVRRAIARYSSAILFKCDVSPIQDYVPGRGTTKAEQRQVLLFHKQGSDVVYALERQAYKDGYHLALGLGGGSCKDYLCQGMICQFLDSGRCRFPLRSRPAIEAMGIDVMALINAASWSAYALVDDLSAIPCAITVGLVFVS